MLGGDGGDVFGGGVREQCTQRVLVGGGGDEVLNFLQHAERVLAVDCRRSGFGLEGRGFRVAVVDLVQAAHEKCVGAGDSKGEDVFERHAGGFGKRGDAEGESCEERNCHVPEAKGTRQKKLGEHIFLWTTCAGCPIEWAKSARLSTETNASHENLSFTGTFMPVSGVRSRPRSARPRA